MVEKSGLSDGVGTGPPDALASGGAVAGLCGKPVQMLPDMGGFGRCTGKTDGLIEGRPRLCHAAKLLQEMPPGAMEGK